MISIPTNGGHTNSTFVSNSNTMYLTKYDDGRFEYYGKVVIPGGQGNIKIGHPFTPVFSMATAANFFSNENNIIVTASSDFSVTRVDVLSHNGLVPQKEATVNLFVKGLWK